MIQPWVEARPYTTLRWLSIIGNSIGIAIAYSAGDHLLNHYSGGNQPDDLIFRNQFFFIVGFPTFCYALPLLLYLRMRVANLSPPPYCFVFCISNAVLGTPIAFLMFGPLYILVTVLFPPILTLLSIFLTCLKYPLAEWWE
jgi:hypothetical protein